MFDQYRLSIMTFPQRFNGGNLVVNVLIVPQIGAQWSGNPLLDLPLGFPNAANYRDRPLQIEPAAGGCESCPAWGEFPAQPGGRNVPLGTAATFPDAVAIYTELQNQFQIKNTVATATWPRLPKPQLHIRSTWPRRTGMLRALPAAHPGDRHRRQLSLCHKGRPGPNPGFQPSPSRSPGAKCMRTACATRHWHAAWGWSARRDSDRCRDIFEDGGFVYATLGEGSDYLAGLAADDHFNYIRHYAARMPQPWKPARPGHCSRRCSFPCCSTWPGRTVITIRCLSKRRNMSDGFGKIVHTSQPISQNLLAEEEDGFPPLHDIGIRSGWDDEQVLEWQNRQLKEREDQPGTGKRLDAPMGVFGYRIDARQLKAKQAGIRSSRCRARPPSAWPGEPGSASRGNWAVEVHPMQLDGDQANGEFWLPVYFANGTASRWCCRMKTRRRCTRLNRRTVRR